ncbi:hypothetical protein LTR84_010144 [Exophiala bonariae]|uniref:YAG7-like dimerisation domain-containing protein n=1 Tax=Exophiala bonariae TaxID=1690606 RepID=A0AAV9MU88_9EURO|nr:hypothetical protein LTR84_010144 [Exophiala bonariae]
MSSSGVVPVDSKSAKKRKTKTEAPVSSGVATPSVEAAADSHTNGADSQPESPYIKELTKNIRNIHKKLAASSKADSVIAENPNVPLDDLVASKKLNADQKAQILKKPALQAQLAQFEEQLTAFKAFAHDLDDKFTKEKSSLTEAHEAEIAAAKEKAAQEAEKIKTDAVEDGLRVINHFLHAAASKRQSEDVDSAESRAFEGTLLLVYQGNDASLETLKSLIYGTDDKVPDVNGELLDYTYAQVKQSAIQGGEHASQDTKQGEIDNQPTESSPPPSYIETDPTIANAGLTELDDTTTIPTNNASEHQVDNIIVPEQATTGADAANAVAESAWDPQASIVTDASTTNEEWVQVPRDPAETESGVAATPATVGSTANWAEEVGAAAEEKAASENDGFEQVKRDRGRGRGGRGSRGDFRGRGRGGGGRGDRGGRGGGGPRGARGGPRGDKS